MALGPFRILHVLPALLGVCVVCVRGEGCVVVGRRKVLMAMYGGLWRVGLAPWCGEAGGPVKDNTW